MGSLQQAMSDIIDELPHIVLSQLMDEKLRAQKITLGKRKLKALVARILGGKVDSITVEYGNGRRERTVTVDLKEDEVANVTERLDKFLDRIPDLIEEMAEKSSSKILPILKRRWPRESRDQKRDINGFKKRLYDRWGTALEGLRMLVTVVREFGSNVNSDLRAAPNMDRPQTFEVLIRLHARACQVSEEVICLLCNGLADGAIARWRTLHEIAAVAYLIGQHGEELAERYIAHDIVETRKAARQYERCRERLGQEPLTENELSQIEAKYISALAKYGRDFANQQGWAAEHLKKANPTIAEIQEASNIDHLAPYYRLASHNVHANPKGVFFKLGLVGESEILLAGPSVSGLADPGHATALSLLQISSALLRLHPTLDTMVAARIMMTLCDEIGESFIAAHRELVKQTEAVA
jgi:hypothetical protein